MLPVCDCDGEGFVEYGYNGPAFLDPQQRSCQASYVEAKLGKSVSMFHE